MFALHRRTHSLATRLAFGIAVLFLVTLACGLAPYAARAQVRIGIGVGGLGVLLEPRSQQGEQYQRNQSATDNNSRKKTTKSRNQKPQRDESKIAKESPPKAKLPEPVASAPQATPLTAGPPPTPDNFGE